MMAKNKGIILAKLNMTSEKD